MELPKQMFEISLHYLLSETAKKPPKNPNLGHAASSLATQLSKCHQHGGRIETTGKKNLKILHSLTLQQHLKGKKNHPCLKTELRHFLEINT